MRRILVYDRAGNGKGELNPNDVFSAVLRENINGEHALEITTTQILEKGTRLLHEDGRGVWREFAVSGIDADHAAGNTVVGSYYCPWSVQEDLMGVTVSVMPGVQVPTSASNALTSLLSSQSRWAKGTVTNTATGGASMYDRSAWEALKVLVDTWGGEVDVTIGVDDIAGVVTRSVDLYAKQGNQTATRRFDFGADADGVVRKLPDDPLFCRISPRGKGEETDAGGYGRKITIESVNDGKDYLEYSPMVDVAKIPDGSSGYIYPTKILTNSKMETPQDLKDWAEGVLAVECTPKVSYSVDVLQSEEAGTSARGVALGDAVQVVDAKFGDGLRIEARVVSMTTDLVAEQVTRVELGSSENSISERFETVGKSVAAMANTLTVMSTAQYVNELVGRINTDINGTGGYTYIVPGEGIICYDVQVEDPLIGTEASKVVQIKGGSMRIANEKNASFAGINDWKWKTVFTSGHIAADLVTAANIVTGSIGNASSGNYWDLDNNQLRLAPTTIIDDGDNTTIDDVMNIDIGNANLVRNGDFASGGITYWTMGHSTSTASVASDSDFESYLSYTQATGGQSYGIYTDSSTSFTHKSGTTYSLSFYAKSDAANTLTVKVGTSSAAANMYFSSEEIGTTWQKYESTITTTTTGVLRFCIDSPGTLYLTNVMLVQGSRPMDFMQDPRDLYSTATSVTAPAAMVRAYGSGILVCRKGNTVGALVNSDGSFDVVQVTWSGNTPTASTVYSSFGTTATVGRAGRSRVAVGSDSVEMYAYLSSSDIPRLFRIGGSNHELTFGDRNSSATVGNWSASIGTGNKSTNTYAVAIGYGNTASGQAAVATGSASTASGDYSFSANSGKATGTGSAAFGSNTTASGMYSAVFGSYNTAAASSQFVCGSYNVTSSNANNVFIVGHGTSTSARKNVMIVDSAGNITITGNVSQGSDRRLKNHIAYLGDDACEFVRGLKPALFSKDEKRHLGFYAQDVQGIDPWRSATVEAQHMDEGRGYDMLTLDYNALIAPLVTYCQHLEKRIATLEAS